MNETVYGNYFDKYASQNPVYRWLLTNFRRNWSELLAMIPGYTATQSLLEIGCADGQFLNWYSQTMPGLNRVVGLEPGKHQIAAAVSRYPALTFTQGSIYDLPFSDNSFDLVTIPEVFEHLDEPEAGLKEITRVASRYIIASVPWEPVWRLCNVLRGAYITDFGNTPGHIQHFSRKAFVDFLGTSAKITCVKTPFPWTMVLAEI